MAIHLFGSLKRKWDATVYPKDLRAVPFTNSLGVKQHRVPLIMDEEVPSF
jgi:hypothetical protein